jgi:prephenate dehydrogenase
MKAFNCIAIVGVGLIGGSIGLAVRRRNPATKVVGFGSREATLETAKRLGAISAIAPDVTSAVADAELVVVCAPVAQIVERTRQVSPLCRPGTLITDAGSTKAEIVRQLEQAATEPGWKPQVSFVGSHPLAGNEKTGPQHAHADLFVGRTVIITPTDKTRREDVESLSDFWTGLGAKVLEMSADQHDRALAATSHLPHLLAAAIAASTPQEYVPLTAGGWQDTTRIAAGDPVLWQQIMLANRVNLTASLDQFADRLTSWRRALASGDSVELERLLTEAKSIRDAVGS